MTRLNRTQLTTGLVAMIAALGLATSASATPRQDETVATTETETRQGPIRIRNVHGYSVLDRQHLVLRAGSRQRYLVTLQRECHDMRFSHQLGLSFDRLATIRNPRFEYVQAGVQRCYFDTIEEVESNDAARALIAARAEAAAEAEAEAADGANSARR